MLPSRNHVYLLLASVLIGLVLGPWCLKLIASDTYQLLFGASSESIYALEGFDQTTEDNRTRLANTGVTATALTDFDVEADLARKEYIEVVEQSRQLKLEQLNALASALVFAVLLTYVCEMAWGFNQRRQAHSTNWESYRAALLGAWLVLVFAQPALIERVSVVFVLLLVALVTLPAVCLARTHNDDKQ